jgi:hypothetical protein
MEASGFGKEAQEVVSLAIGGTAAFTVLVATGAYFRQRAKPRVGLQGARDPLVQPHKQQGLPSSAHDAGARA